VFVSIKHIQKEKIICQH